MIRFVHRINAARRDTNATRAAGISARFLYCKPLSVYVKLILMLFAFIKSYEARSRT